MALSMFKGIHFRLKRSEQSRPLGPEKYCVYLGAASESSRENSTQLGELMEALSVCVTTQAARASKDLLPSLTVTGGVPLRFSVKDTDPLLLSHFSTTNI